MSSTKGLRHEQNPHPPTMRPDECRPPSRLGRAKQIPRSVLRFSRSAVAEYVVYFLLGYSTTAVVTLFVFTPVDSLLCLWRGELTRDHLVNFHYSGIFLPFNFSFSNFPLPTRILLVALWVSTARPALALAGFIVQKRLPAYTHPSEQYPPIRWLFEITCSLANRYHKLVPDIELYARQTLRLLGVPIAASSYQLGTIPITGRA